MKVYVQVVDLNSGIYQSGMIDEPTGKGFEIQNAVGHFGVSDVIWDSETDYSKSGRVSGTSKIVNVAWK